MHGMTKKELTENDIKPYVEKFTATLEQYLIPDFSKLKDFTLDGIGVLELVFSDGTKKMLDIKPEGRILLSRLALERVKQSNAREALKEEINSESYLGGNIIAVFETITSSTLAP